LKRVTGWIRALPVVAALAGGCALSEVAAPAGEDFLVIESVLRAGSPSQQVLLHRSMEGRAIRGEPGATVEVRGQDGLRVVYEERPIEDCLATAVADWEIEEVELEASCYVSPRSAGFFVRTGGKYELFVRTRAGVLARGRTEVPGGYGLLVPGVALDATRLSATCVLPARSFELTWRPAEGASSYIVTLRLAGWGEDLREQGIEVDDPLELTGLSISAADTTLLFPTFLGLFQRARLDQRIFAALGGGVSAGTDATLVVAAIDRNYTNALRGGRFNPSGTIRGSSIVGAGATGLFGSVVPLTIWSPGGSSPGLSPCPIPE